MPIAMLSAVIEEKQLLRRSIPFLSNRCQLYNRWSKGKNNLSFDEAFALSGKRKVFGMSSISLFAEGKNNFNPLPPSVSYWMRKKLCLIPNLSSGKMTSLANLILQRLRWILRIFNFFRLSFLFVIHYFITSGILAHSCVLFSFIDLLRIFFELGRL